MYQSDQHVVKSRFCIIYTGKLAGAPYFNDDRGNCTENNDLKNKMFEFDKINFNKEDYGYLSLESKNLWAHYL